MATEIEDVYGRVRFDTTSIFFLAIQAVVNCVKAIDKHPNKVSLSENVEAMMAINLGIVSAIYRGRSVFDDDSLEPALVMIYKAKPWRFGLAVREALYEVVTNTTSHAPSFEVMFQIMKRCTEAKREGYDAMEDHLFQELSVAAVKYLDRSKHPIVYCDIQAVLDSWDDDEDVEIKSLVRTIRKKNKIG